MESMEFDVVIVGAGASGLSAAIRLKQLSDEINVCVIEKGAEIGAHILSGAVIEPRALDELFPDWRNMDTPLDTPVTKDSFLWLGKNISIPLPTPPQMKNEGNYVISLGNFCRWLGSEAEKLGVQIFSGFPAKEALYDDEGKVIGVITGEFGRSEDGGEKDGFQPSMELRAEHTLFAEGCRGSVTKTLEKKFNLRKDASPQTYGLGVKELWEVLPEKHKKGSVLHTIGWPLDSHTYGGSFMYHIEDNQVAIGFVVGLDYRNPYLSPFKEFQRFKTHSRIRKTLEGGKRISYGARALTEGGYQSIPKLTFSGGAVIGCSAGLMNVTKIKGIHTAMKSGMLAAEAIIAGDLSSYEESIKNSWIYEELYSARNIRPSFKFGVYAGMVYSAISTYVFQGKEQWTFNHHHDHKYLKPIKKCKKTDYPKPDGKISFDLLSSVYISNTAHAEDQPVHLIVEQKDVKTDPYGSPEQYYCPAGVYEIVDDKLQINSENCLHCKTCDIKDPECKITWVTPEGGGGPNYPNM